MARAVMAHEQPVVVAPGVVRVTASNPGVMTGSGTNTYLVGTAELAVIDPGPDDPGHLEAIAAAGAGRIRWIFVTHTHPDHAPGAAALAERTGASRLGFVSRDGFVADQAIGDGYVLQVPGLSLQAVHTPGHASNHLCFLFSGSSPGVAGGSRRLLFSGDHIMDGSTVVIAPPDGDMRAYMASLELLRAPELHVDAIAPGHGHLIEQPAAAIDAYLAHRARRTARVVAVLSGAGRGTIDDLVAQVYDDVDPGRHPIARRSLWADLRSLAEDGMVRTDDPDDPGGTWVWLGGPRGS